MKLIVGLGNPGEKYARNRHNAGFMVIDHLVTGGVLSPSVDKKSNSIIYKKGDEAVFQKPQTFMNASGKAVRTLADFYKIDLDHLLIVHDEVDLPFGEIKHQFARGAAGHNGVESVIEAFGTEAFHRLRIGVGRPSVASFEVHDWVLEDFSEDEDDVERMIERAAEVVENWIKS